MTIATLLQRKGAEVVTVPPTAPVREVVALLAERGIGAVVVVADGTVAGVFSERDVIRFLADGGNADLSAAVADLMSAPVVTAAPDDAPLGALAVMTQRRIRHLPVVRDGALVGIVSIGDLVKFRIDAIEADAAPMRDYIQSA